MDSNSIKVRVANELIKARNEVNMTQRELSLRTGIDQADISKLEKGFLNPTILLLERLAKAMDMDVYFEFIPIKKEEIPP